MSLAAPGPAADYRTTSDRPLGPRRGRVVPDGLNAQPWHGHRRRSGPMGVADRHPAAVPRPARAVPQAFFQDSPADEPHQRYVPAAARRRLFTLLAPVRWAGRERPRAPIPRSRGRRGAPPVDAVHRVLPARRCRQDRIGEGDRDRDDRADARSALLPPGVPGSVTRHDALDHPVSEARRGVEPTRAGRPIVLKRVADRSSPGHREDGRRGGQLLHEAGELRRRDAAIHVAKVPPAHRGPRRSGRSSRSGRARSRG